MTEIDVLPASQKKSGDAILIRIGTFSYEDLENNSQTVILIDSGYTDTSKIIEDYLHDYYHTETIDMVFVTHPDTDHISGLLKLLDSESVKIEKTFILDPWNHSVELYHKIEDRRVTPNSIGKKLEESMSKLATVLDKLDSKNTEVFAGCCDEKLGLYILGPTKKYYENLLLEFPGMEKERNASNEKIYMDKHTEYDPSFKHFLDNPKTSARNDSSLIICLCDTQQKPIALFTGDAGVSSIKKALYFAKKRNFNLKNISWFQLPHHGSLKNIDEEILDDLTPNGVFVSAADDDAEPPSKLLVNYLIENSIIYRHIGSSKGICFLFDGAPLRPGWSSVKDSEPFEKVLKLKDGV